MGSSTCSPATSCRCSDRNSTTSTNAAVISSVTHYNAHMIFYIFLALLVVHGLINVFSSHLVSLFRSEQHHVHQRGGDLERHALQRAHDLLHLPGAAGGPWAHQRVLQPPRVAVPIGTAPRPPTRR